MVSEFVWGKGSGSEEDSSLWLPLWLHLRDTKEVAEGLWEGWIPSKIKRMIAEDLGVTIDQAGVFFAFLSGTHDIGKSTPDFSGRTGVVRTTENLYIRMLEHGFEYDDITNRKDDCIRHEIASGHYLTKILGLGGRKKQPQTIAAVICGHHGSPASAGKVRSSYALLESVQKQWVDVAAELVDFIFSSLPGVQGVIEHVAERGITTRSQVLLTSLVILSDWIASDSSRFPLLQFGETPRPSNTYLPDRTETGLDELELPVTFDATLLPEVGEAKFDEHFNERFGLTGAELRPSQRELLRLVSDDATDPTDIFVLEAQMGEGKTEAALLAAEVLMRRTDSAGFFVGLPTMATTEALFARTLPFVEELLMTTDQNSAVVLSHSKAVLSELYANVNKRAKANEDDAGIVSAGWINDRRRKFLASFIAGTVDNFLMLSLKMRYAYWRHLGFASKVIIIDEVHSADEYMSEYLKRSIEWAAFYECPVILLSATLTNQKREELIASYATGKEARLAIV